MENVTQFQETQRVPVKANAKRPTQRHIIIKMATVMTKRESQRQKETVSYLQE